MGQKRTWRDQIAMSALPPIADIRPRDQDVCFGPIADIRLCGWPPDGTYFVSAA
jgi:hypothetical protein